MKLFQLSNLDPLSILSILPMASEPPHHDTQLHFLVIPLMSPGHYIPTIDIANLLAQHGVKVTIVTTPVNALRFGSILHQPIKSGLPIHFLELPFQTEKFGLPEGCESLDDAPNLGMAKEFSIAQSSLQQEVEQYIETLNPKPNCIISASFLLWPAETAKMFQIPRVIFDGMNCFTQMCNHVLRLTKVHETVSESESFVLPGLPDRIELTRSQLPFAFNSGSKDVKDFHEKLLVAESEAYGVIINSFHELENQYADEFQKIKEDKAWCVGPLSLCYKDVSEKVQRGNKSSISEIECIKWLDSQETGSVIYACLGSISRVDPDQLVELALALESSRKPFIWVVRAGPNNTPKIEKWIEEEGFEERTKERGLLIRGWAPQLVVLSHVAIGGFLTHCGWNSTLEGVCAGVPMVTWPQFQEQFFNEKLVVQVLRIGVSVGAQNVVHWGEEKSGVQVKSEELRKAIEIVMEEGKEGEERRKRAKELSVMAHKAIEEGGSSYRNMTRLIDDIRNQVRLGN